MVRNYSNVFGDNFFKNIIDNPELFPVNFTYGDKEYKGFNKDFSLLSKNVKCKNQKMFNRRFSRASFGCVFM